MLDPLRRRFDMAPNRKRDPRSDATLVGICNEGDARAAGDAFEALYRRHKDFVLRVALRFAPDVDTALDVLQDTFVQLLRRFPPSGEGLRLTAKMTTLLYPIARNAAISAQRKASGLPLAGEVAPDDLPAPPAREADGIGRLLAELPAGQREALTLRFVDGLTLEEIAQALDIPLGTVKSRLHLGIAALKSSPLARELLE